MEERSATARRPSIVTISAPTAGLRCCATPGAPNWRAGCTPAREPVRISHRDAGIRTYVRDAADRLAVQVGADGGRLSYDFDGLGRVTGVDSVPPGGGAPTRIRRSSTTPIPTRPTRRRAGFLDGRVAVLREGAPGERAECRYSYDRAGRLVGEEQTVAGVTDRIGRAFDLQGRLTTLTYPDGTRVDYDLHAGGTVTAVAGFATDIEYAADGSLLGYRLPSGVRVAQSRSGHPAPCRRPGRPSRGRRCPMRCSAA